MSVSVSATRERTKKIRREIDAGAGPLAQRGAMREAPRVDDLIERYGAQHLPKLAKQNAVNQRSSLTKMVAPVWGRKLVTEITSTDVDKLFNEVAGGRARPHKEKPNNRAKKLQPAKRTPVRANRIGEVLRKMFALAVEWGWCEDNPAQRFHRRIETPRERFLSKEEIAKLAAALDAVTNVRAADIIRMCILTGARLGEVRQAQFEQFNLEHLSWLVPPTMTKHHCVPISDETATIVRQRRLCVPRGTPWIFPSDTLGQPVQEVRRFWAQIQKQCGLREVHIYDLRHTFASLLVSGVVPLEMIGYARRIAATSSENCGRRFRGDQASAWPPPSKEDRSSMFLPVGWA